MTSRQKAGAPAGQCKMENTACAWHIHVNIVKDLFYSRWPSSPFEILYKYISLYVCVLSSCVKSPSKNATIMSLINWKPILFKLNIRQCYLGVHNVQYYTYVILFKWLLSVLFSQDQWSLCSSLQTPLRCKASSRTREWKPEGPWAQHPEVQSVHQAGRLQSTQ